MCPPRRAARAVLLAALVAALVALAGCGSSSGEFPDDTVRVELLDDSYELEVISCGRDEDLDVFLLGARSADSFLQLLLSIDGDEVDTGASAVSFETRDTGVLAAGDDALLGSRGAAPGTIETASIRGDRIDVEASLEPVGDAGAAADEVTDARIDLVGRCAGAEEVALGPRRAQDP